MKGKAGLDQEGGVLKYGDYLKYTKKFELFIGIFKQIRSRMREFIL
jgi:hypothetical protein